MRTSSKWRILTLLISFVVIASANASPAAKYNEGVLAAEAGNYKEAVAQWQVLAKQGNADAQFNLALLYHSGSGVKLDEARAVQLYHQAAKNGNYYAQQYLTVGYQEGWFGLTKDPQKAEYWREQMHKQHPNAE